MGRWVTIVWSILVVLTVLGFIFDEVRPDRSVAPTTNPAASTTTPSTGPTGSLPEGRAMIRGAGQPQSGVLGDISQADPAVFAREIKRVRLLCNQEPWTVIGGNVVAIREPNRAPILWVELRLRNWMGDENALFCPNASPRATQLIAIPAGTKLSFTITSTTDERGVRTWHVMPRRWKQNKVLVP